MLVESKRAAAEEEDDDEKDAESATAFAGMRREDWEVEISLPPVIIGQGPFSRGSPNLPRRSTLTRR